MIWELMYRTLKDAGIDVYTPSQHEGDCVSPYVVISPQGSNRFNEYSTEVINIDVLCYVPMNKFSMLDPFVNEVKGILEGIYPVIKNTYNDVPGFPDDSNKSMSWSISYEGHKQLKTPIIN